MRNISVRRSQGYGKIKLNIIWKYEKESKWDHIMSLLCLENNGYGGHE